MPKDIKSSSPLPAMLSQDSHGFAAFHLFLFLPNAERLKRNG